MASGRSICGHRPTAAASRAKVIVVEPTGAEIHIYADLAGEEVCAVTQDRLQLDPGDEVRLMPMLDRVHLFDQATGKALVGLTMSFQGNETWIKQN